MPKFGGEIEECKILNNTTIGETYPLLLLWCSSSILLSVCFYFIVENLLCIQGCILIFPLATRLEHFPYAKMFPKYHFYIESYSTLWFI